MRAGDECRSIRGANLDGVEERIVHDVGLRLDEPLAERRRARGDICRDPAQSIRAVINRVHRCHDGEQHLSGADVRGGLLTTDVLLARLQREAVRGPALGIHRDADEATGQLTLEPLTHGHVPGVRAAERHRHTEALGGAHRDIRAERTG